MESLSGVRLVWDGKEHEIIERPLEYGSRVEVVYPHPLFQSNNLFGERLDNPPQLEPASLNRIYQGDNLAVLNLLLQQGFAGKIDLIYIDPPYLSNSNYNSRISVEHQGQKYFIERLAFKDRDEDLVSYLQQIYKRLKIMKMLLSEQGSIFVHLDWHSSHYVKILLDEIFSNDNFINEIIWCYGGGSGTRRHFHRKHDQILWYGKGKDYTFNPQYRPYTEGTLQRGLTRVKGKKYTLHKEGALLQDWWVDINKILSPTARENLKFPTQKPLALLKRIIASASNPGDLVADFYAGSGTTAEACEEMNRSWISCDCSKLSIQSSRYRLLRKKARPFQITELIDEDNEEQKPGILELIVPEVCSYDEKQAMVKLGISRYDSPLFPFENRNFVSCLDFWELDCDYDGCFSSQLQVIREKPDYNLPLPLQLSVLLPKQEEYSMAIKSYDIFGDSIIKSFTFPGCQ